MKKKNTFRKNHKPQKKTTIEQPISEEQITAKTEVETPETTIKAINRKSLRKIKKGTWAAEDRKAFQDSIKINWDNVFRTINEPKTVATNESNTIDALVGIVTAAISQKKYKEARVVLGSIVELTTNGQHMTEVEKNELLQVLERVEIKTIEVAAMMKDGKFIIAYEKLGGVTKVVQQLMRNIASIESDKV